LAKIGVPINEVVPGLLTKDGSALQGTFVNLRTRRWDAQEVVWWGGIRRGEGDWWMGLGPGGSAGDFGALQTGRKREKLLTSQKRKRENVILRLNPTHK